MNNNMKKRYLYFNMLIFKTSIPDDIAILGIAYPNLYHRKPNNIPISILLSISNIAIIVTKTIITIRI